jgi:hypothetical protein
MGARQKLNAIVCHGLLDWGGGRGICLSVLGRLCAGAVRWAGAQGLRRRDQARRAQPIGQAAEPLSLETGRRWDCHGCNRRTEAGAVSPRRGPAMTVL